MLKAEKLKKSFGVHLLFDDLTFNVNPGDRIGLVGRNGSGKTTLLRILAGLEEADGGAVATSRGYRVGYLDQDLKFSEPTIADEACRGLPPGQGDRRWEAEKILMGLGFTASDMARPPAEFSGGYQVRLNLARLLVSAPDLLLLDEPTNFLDVVAIRWLERFFSSWKGELILITHDRSFMDSVCASVMGIHRRRIRRVEGDTAKYYRQIAQEEEIHEKSRINLERKRQQTEDFIRRFRAKARLVGLVQSRIRTLQKQKVPERLESLRSLDFSFRFASTQTRVLLAAEDLAFGYDPPAPRLFEGLRLQVARDDRVAVVGPNGRGKSTLLRVLAGLLDPVRGSVRSHAEARIGYFGQINTADLVPSRTVLEEILEGDPDRSVQKARAVCGTMMFEGDAALKRISVLSGGEKSRVLLGRLLVQPHNLLLLDEPTNHLDMDSCEALLDALEDFEGAVVIVTHNEMFLHRLARRLVVFDRGGAEIFDGTYGNFLDELGWSDETLAAGMASSADMRARDALKAGARKADRRSRALLVQERSRELRPLEERVRRVEERLSALESEARRRSDELVQASVRGDSEAIARCGRECKRLSAEIEAGYNELFKATEDMERAVQSWRTRDLDEY